MFAMPVLPDLRGAGARCIELAGYLVTVAALAFGLLDWRFAELMFLTAVVYGALISVAAVVLEEVSFRKYPRLARPAAPGDVRRASRTSATGS